MPISSAVIPSILDIAPTKSPALSFFFLPPLRYILVIFLFITLAFSFLTFGLDFKAFIASSLFSLLTSAIYPTTGILNPMYSCIISNNLSSY